VIGSDGALYVVHTGDGTTTRIDLKTMAATEYVHPATGTFISDDITADDKGNLYSTGTTPLVGEVYRIDPAGTKTVIARGPSAPNASGGRLLRIDPRKISITVIAAVDFGAPLFVTPTGDIYLATAGRGVVQLKKSR
jgi:streptogramin lyase